MWVFISLIFSYAQTDLVCVVEATRHGARAPISEYTWDTGSWPEGLGQLTGSGMRQHYLIGRELHRRYVQTGLLSSSFLQQEVYVRSTDVNRTLMSAQSQLLGLYPKGPNLTQSLADTVTPPLKITNLTQIRESLGLEAVINQYQPVPIHTVREQYDYMLRGYSSSTCPKIGVLANQLQQETEYKNRVSDYEKEGGLKDKLKAALNQEIPFEDAGWMADTIFCDLWHDYALPTPFTQEMYYEMLGIMNYTISYYFKGEGGLLASSQFFEAILGHFDGIKSQDSQVKFAFYSAHDVTLNGFRSALDFFDGKNPPFASSLIFELYKNDTVRTLYNDKVITLKGCDQLCDYSTFKAYLTSLIIPNVEQVCQNLTETEWDIAKNTKYPRFYIT